MGQQRGALPAEDAVVWGVGPQLGSQALFVRALAPVRAAPFSRINVHQDLAWASPAAAEHRHGPDAGGWMLDAGRRMPGVSGSEAEHGQFCPKEAVSKTNPRI